MNDGLTIPVGELKAITAESERLGRWLSEAEEELEEFHQVQAERDGYEALAKRRGEAAQAVIEAALWDGPELRKIPEWLRLPLADLIAAVAVPSDELTNG